MQLSRLQRVLNYDFKNVSLLNQALTHKSANRIHNERLEFLGDSLVNMVVAQLLYQRFDKATEGQLTQLRSSLVKQATLSEVAQEFKLGDYLNLGIGERRSGGFKRDSILGDALEAIIAAIYIDGGFNECSRCIESWFKSRLEGLVLKGATKDAKTRLQEWLQSQQLPLPLYEVTATHGTAHDRRFVVSCTINGIDETTEGNGNSIRIAEQQAAQQMWEKIKIE